MPLGGVEAVLVHVGHVVQQVDRAGEDAEDGEGRDASQMSGVKSCCEKMTPAKTKRFFTHWRGRSERMIARHEAHDLGPAGSVHQTRVRRTTGARRRHLVDLRVGELREARQREHLARRPRGLGEARSAPGREKSGWREMVG